MRRLLHEETIITEFEPEQAPRSLPRLVRTSRDRRTVHAYLDRIEQALPLNDRQRALTTGIRGALVANSRAASPAGRKLGKAPRRPLGAAARARKRD